MGVMTLSEMAQEIYFGLGQRNEADPSTVSGAAFLTQRIRDAYRHVCSPKVFDHPALRNLKVDLTLGGGTNENNHVESFALPARLRAVDVVRNETDGIRWDPDRFENFMNRGVSPRRWARRGQRIYLPVNESTNGNLLRIHYTGRPDLILAATSGFTEIDEEWDTVIVELGISFAFGRLGNTALADYHQAIAATMIEDNIEAASLEAKNAGWTNDLLDTDPYQERG